MGQRTFETRSLYLILAEKLFTLPAANEMLPVSALFAGKYREPGAVLTTGFSISFSTVAKLTQSAYGLRHLGISNKRLRSPVYSDGSIRIA